MDDFSVLNWTDNNDEENLGRADTTNSNDIENDIPLPHFEEPDDTNFMLSNESDFDPFLGLDESPVDENNVIKVLLEY